MLFSVLEGFVLLLTCCAQGASVHVEVLYIRGLGFWGHFDCCIFSCGHLRRDSCLI